MVMKWCIDQQLFMHIILVNKQFLLALMFLQQVLRHHQINSRLSTRVLLMEKMS